MSTSDVKYHVKVPLNASKTSAPGDNLPTGNRVVTYNSSSGEFDMFPTNPVSLRYEYQGNSNNTYPLNGGRYKLYSAYNSSISNTSTNDFSSVAVIAIHYDVLAFESNSDDGTQLDMEDYLSSFTSGIIEVIADTQSTSDLIFGRFEITNTDFQSQYALFYVTVLASSNIAGDEQQAGYEASFIFKGGGGGNPVVQQARQLTPGGTDQYFTLSRVKDGTETVLSASAAFVYKSIGAIFDTQSFELVADTGSLTTNDPGNPIKKNLALVTKVPLRLQASESLSPVQPNYEFPYTTPVAASTEHIIVTRSGALSAGQKIDFVTLHTYPYKGTSSYDLDSSGFGEVWEQYSYARVEHLATSYDGGKTQQLTYHFTWLKTDNGGGTSPSSLRCTSIENARSPINGLIVDPMRTTGSFNTSTPGLNIDVYHYNIDYAQHIFKYMFI